MPKPILSDSLFNADDVATAILNKANLEITNSQLGVTDQSSILSYATGWNDAESSVVKQLYSFNGFAFISISCLHVGTPTDGETILTITDSNYHPIKKTTFVSSAQGDTTLYIAANTNGNITISTPNVLGSGMSVVFNGFYRYS